MSEGPNAEVGHRVQVTLIAVFAASLALANVLAAKLAWFELPMVGGVAVPAGFVGIGVAFLCTDLLSEFYGRDIARNVVNGTIVALVVGWMLVYASLWMPAAPFYQDAAAFSTTFGSGATIVLASILTLLVSQNVDVSVFHHIRERTPSRVARNVGSTAVSQLVDTVLFIWLAFVVLPMFMAGDPQTLGAAGSLIVGQYIVKVLVALADTPVFIAASAGIDRYRRVVA